MKREAGFSFVELLITMTIIGVVLAATSDTFIGLLRNYKQQSKIAETNIEGIIGLEMLRRDIESAGYGLPWAIPGTAYSEATNLTAAAYNDSPSDPPRAILCGDAAGWNETDYLVVKAINVAGNQACSKWQYLMSSVTTSWTTTSENLSPNDRVIIISPGTPKTGSRTLMAPTGSPLGALQLSNVASLTSSEETRIIYGVDGDTNLRMPFNRADYYVNTTGQIPSRCAPGTGILKKAVVDQSSGAFSGNTYPLLDCVADMQVVTLLDMDVPPDGRGETYYNGLTAADAKTLRDQLKEVHVYILAHEGQRDTSYTHPMSTILVGEQVGANVYGRNFDISTIPHWQNYRWKVYTLVVRPNNLR